MIGIKLKIDKTRIDKTNKKQKKKTKRTMEV
jgi:hypothetical protein